MSLQRAATIVPLPAPDADYRLIVPVLRELAASVDLVTTFQAAGSALQKLARFDWLALSYRSLRDGEPLLHTSLSGRPEWLANSAPLDTRSERHRQWFLPEVPRIAGPDGVPGTRGDASWPVPGDIGSLVAIPLPAGAGGQREDAARARRRGALVLGRAGGQPFEPSTVSLLEPCVAHLLVLLERIEWLESFRATNVELRARLVDLQRSRDGALRVVTTEALPETEAVASAEAHQRWIAVDRQGQELLDVIERAASTDLAVLLQGESGTGKELLGRTLHRMSERADCPYVEVNVATLRPELAASELFGHVQGAFTDARGDRTGLIEAAHGGTLFLDEIGDMPAEVQPALLRFLEDGHVRPVGTNQQRWADVRIVCATHRDLRALVAAGAFREDLYHRLAGLVVDVPPLRDRPADLLPLASRFLREASGGRRRDLPTAWLSALRAHAWPGNVRELRNAMRAVGLLSRGPELEPRFLPSPLRELVQRGLASALRPGSRTGEEATEDHDDHLPAAIGRPSPAADDAYDGWTLVEVEREMVRRALRATAGHRGQAAARLGISARALYDKLKRLDIEL